MKLSACVLCGRLQARLVVWCLRQMHWPAPTPEGAAWSGRPQGAAGLADACSAFPAVLGLLYFALFAGAAHACPFAEEGVEESAALRAK